jgi:hypothetical protein
MNVNCDDILHLLVLMKEKKVELKASLIQELEHKKKIIENERNTMELTGGELIMSPSYFSHNMCETQLFYSSLRAHPIAT